MSLEELDEAQPLTAVVDTIIFEDGRVVGPDEPRLADFIHGIAVSIKALVNEIRKALSEGRDLDEILRNLLSMKRTPSAASFRDDPAGFSLINEANLLLRMPYEQRMHRLQQLEGLPAPPVFYRVHG